MDMDPYLTVQNATRPVLYFQARGETYEDAIESCETDYAGKIAVLKEPDILNRISAVIPTAYSHYYRVGLKKDFNDDAFRWDDGSLFENGTLEMPDVKETRECLAMSVYKPSGPSKLLLRPVECSRALAYICQSEERPDDLDGNQVNERVALAAATATAATICLLLVVAFVAVFLIRRNWSKAGKNSEREVKTSTTTVLMSDSEYAEVPPKQTGFDVKIIDQDLIPGYQDVGYSSIDELAEQGVFYLESGCDGGHDDVSTPVYTMAAEVADVSALYSVVNKKAKRSAVRNENEDSL